MVTTRTRGIGDAEAVPSRLPGDRTKITIAIADDHVIVRHALRALIEAERDMRVIAEAGTVAETERVTRAHRPTVLLLALTRRGRSGLPSIARLRDASPQTAIVVLTIQGDPGLARRALQTGALGFVLSEAADEELLEAIRLAAAGERYLTPRLGARLAAFDGEPSGPSDRLTGREVEILRLIALGHTNAEVAQQFVISVRTVEIHRAHIRAKLGRRSRAELVRYALEHRIIEL
jgi:two-component system response regulator NreC